MSSTLMLLHSTESQISMLLTAVRMLLYVAFIGYILIFKYNDTVNHTIEKEKHFILF